MQRSSQGSKRIWRTGFIDHDGAILRYAVNLSDQKTVDRFVVFFNGRTEWIEKYSHLCTSLDLPQSCGFLTWDHRGQGGSSGVRGHIDDYGQFARDARAIITHVVKNIPYVAISHSMGGLILLSGVLSKQINPKGLILCSPLLKLPNQPVPRWLLYPLSLIASSTGFRYASCGGGGIERVLPEGNPLTHSLEVFDQEQHPPYPVPTPTFGWLLATARASEEVFELDRLKNLEVPILMLGGTEESVVDFSSFSAWTIKVKTITRVSVDLALISGARHELLAESPEYYEQAVRILKKQLRAWSM